ncbi:Acetoacetate decarboxylase family protein [Sulfidibacter corallicola]|uniref:Acetoacetate decarboxylase family protein n=1 Tax=Sulfidibacter corallicola TaxID=2818388 RepID=A0A8A4TJT4_SULCO|nr:acetoacetate decarboxylase family protein [Sulfidibacter corallicola]QTD49121.1 acetoacetate decarboxylase family protein [Sulfidibacter corallicola]
MTTAPLPSKLSEAVLVPPPWHLRGCGYILSYYFPRHLLDIWSRHFPQGTGTPTLPFGTVMLVDYRESDAGPYRELLLMPGVFRYGLRFHPTITRIYVSTHVSMVNGRRNWGIPKELADFSITQEEEGVERIRLSLEGHTFVDMRLGTRGPSVPVTTATVLPYFRSICQNYEGRRMLIPLAGNGRMCMARLQGARIDHGYFPDFTRGTLLGAWKVTEFGLHFPIAKVLNG